MRAVRGVGLTLEPQRQGHAPAMFELLADPAIYRFENTPPPSLAALRRRYARLERRQSPDGRQTWLNWVVRLPDGRLAGFVQATIDPAGAATIAYVLSSDHWGRGLGRRAVAAMLDELAARYEVTTAIAVLKCANTRSVRLLSRLGFRPFEPPPETACDPDERAMIKCPISATRPPDRAE